MYKYALCTIVLYIVCLDNCNSIRRLIFYKLWIQNDHSLCLAGAEI